jgi:hypothetical protein
MIRFPHSLSESLQLYAGILFLVGPRPQWLRNYATSRKDADSRFDKVNDFYQFTYSFQPHYAPRFTEHLTELSTRDRNKNVSGE